MARGTEHECTSCGGPLGIPADGDRYTTCQFCGTVVELDLPPVPDDEPDQPWGDFTTTEPIGTSGGRRGALVGMVVLVAAGLAIFAGIDTSASNQAVPDVSDEIRDALAEFGEAPTGDNTSGLYGITAARLVVAEDDTSPDVLAAGPAPDAEALLVLLDAEADGGIRWRAPLQEADVYMEVLVQPDRFILGVKDRLHALDRTDGHELWSVGLSDQVQHHICHDCLQRFGDLIVVLTIDGVITGFDDDGTVRWQRTLAETPRQIVDVDGRPAVFDVTDDVRMLHVLDPAEGTTVQQVPVSCPDTVFGGRDEVGPYDWLVPIGGGSFVHLSDGPTSPCAQRWDPGAESPAWEATIDLPFAAQLDPEHVIEAEGRLHLVGRDRAVVVDLATGETGAGFTSEDHDLIPVFATADTLVVGAESTRGSRSWELWGLDLATGTVAWAHPVEARQFAEGWATPVRDDGMWQTFPTAGGITLLQAFAEQPVRLTSFDVESGEVASEASVAIDGGFAPTVDVLSWRADTVWLRVDTSVLVVDVTTGEVTDELS